MGCFAALLALISPRVALIFIWLFSAMIGRALEEWWIAVLGFVLLPWTTLAYVVFWDAGTSGVEGFEWFLVIVAFVFDMGGWGQGRKAGRRR